MPHSSRRRFVRLCLTVPAAMLAGGRGLAALRQGLGQFTAGPPPCSPDLTATPATPVGPDFKPKAPERSSLLEAGVTGKKLVLTGTVSGLKCGVIKRALVEFWQADARGIYDNAGFRLRGRQYTDSSGGYRLETIVPGPSDKRAPHLHVRVEPPGKPAFTTQLFFPDAPQNKTDPVFRPELVMKVADTAGGKSASFNILLDL